MKWSFSKKDSGLTSSLRANFSFTLLESEEVRKPDPRSNLLHLTHHKPSQKQPVSSVMISLRQRTCFTVRLSAKLVDKTPRELPLCFVGKLLPTEELTPRVSPAPITSQSPYNRRESYPHLPSPDDELSYNSGRQSVSKETERGE